MAAHVIFDASLQSEVRGKGKGPNDAHSIEWDSFEKVGYSNVGGIICIDWLKHSSVTSSLPPSANDSS